MKHHFSWNISHVCGMHSSPLQLSKAKVSSGGCFGQNHCSPCVQIKPGRKTHECHILGEHHSTRTVHNEEKVAHTGVTAPYCSYCLHAPDTARKNTITQGMRTSAHIFKSTGPIRGLRAAPMKTSYMKLPDMRICSPRATVQKVSPEGYGEAPDHGDRHDVAIVIDDLR